MLITDMDLLSRRALIAAPFFIKNLISAPANGRVRLAAMGASNMAWHTLKNIAAHSSVDLVSVAEIDTSRTTEVKDKYPGAKHYQDWRKMLDAEYRNLDAICVGTPDHMHAPQAMAAMQRGLHVYCQKPLTSKVAEARKLKEFASAKNLVTQMGIQVHSSVEYKTAVAMVQSGTIGKIKEVHTWSNKKWGDMDKRPKTKDTVPSTLDWNGWLGVAPVSLHQRLLPHGELAQAAGVWYRHFRGYGLPHLRPRICSARSHLTAYRSSRRARPE